MDFVNASPLKQSVNDLLPEYSMSNCLLVSVNVSSLRTNHSVSTIAGNDISLPCRYNTAGPVWWLYIKSELSSQDIISEDELIQSEYEDKATVVRSARNYNLLLRSVRLIQSGFYICIEDGSKSLGSPIQLTVLGEFLRLLASASCSNGHRFVDKNEHSKP